MAPSKIQFLERMANKGPFVSTHGLVFDALTEGQAFLSEHPKCHGGMRQSKEVIFIGLIAAAFRARDYKEELRRLALYLDCEITDEAGRAFKFNPKEKPSGADVLADEKSGWQFNDSEWAFND